MQSRNLWHHLPFERKGGDLVVGHLNIRSLVNKHDELRVFMEKRSRALVLGLSETWLDDSISDAELEYQGSICTERTGIEGEEVCWCMSPRM